MKTRGELEKELRVVCDKYLELRDAKSDGCMHGKPMSVILAYDDTILAEAAKAKALREEIERRRTLVEFLKDCRDDYLEVLIEKEGDGGTTSWNLDKLEIVRTEIKALIQYYR